MSKLPKPSGIIFDWDNTLADSWPVIHKSINNSLQELGHDEWSLEETKLKLYNSIRTVFPDMFGDRWEEARNIYRKHYFKNRVGNINLLPGALNLLNKLKSAQIPLFIVSNKIGDSLRMEVQTAGVTNYFQSIIGSLDAKSDKPSKEPVLLAIKEHNIKLDKNVWFVGDSIIDMECALNCNTTPILIGEEHSKLSKELDKDRNIKYLDSLSCVEKLIT